MTGSIMTQTDTEVHLTKTTQREEAIRSLLGKFDLRDFHGKTVALKANFNSADPFPASTHLATLETIVKILNESGVGSLTLVERSGMGDTRGVLESTGLLDLSRNLGFKVLVLDEADKREWVKIGRKGTHWLRGFSISRTVIDAEKVVQTCCLKTHRFGGHFTMSLKNSVGLVAKRVPGGPYDYMWELHGSPYQRLMIAEINKFYRVDLVVMDAMKAFVSDGPERGDVVEPDLMLASKDRVAIDAVGVAILRTYGSTKNVTKGRIFELDQIRRAADLGVGAKSASEIRLVPLTEKSREAADKIRHVLETQG
jgi:uncharacterized protein (DUF362 family)